MKNPLVTMIAIIVAILLVIAITVQYSPAGETGRDGRFIAYDNGTVLDRQTNLMWAVKDNGLDTNWQGAKSYCGNYRGGGYTDWRMPTQNELAKLFDGSKSRPGSCSGGFDLHVVTELIDITCFDLWTSETNGPHAAYFVFNSGGRLWDDQFFGSHRALPVRSGK